MATSLFQKRVEQEEPELPFLLLADEEKALSEQKQSLNAKRNIKVLYHNAWRQEILSAEHAEAILITGGDSFGEHFELEGSVTISLSRYLHIQTNLWLSEFEPNFGQTSKLWPNLPERPKAISIDTLQPENTLAAQDESLAITLEPQIQDAPLSIDLAIPDSGFSQTQTHTNAFTDYSALTQSPYVTKHIVTLRQKRRMRSGELHYIDHPKLGLLVKIVEYIPEKDEENEQES